MNIAILGCGTVGAGVIRLLRANGCEIEKRLGEPLVLRYVLARHPERAMELGVPAEQITRELSPILADPEVDTVVELIGGVEDANRYIRAALSAGKHVVTANKDVIALYLNELSGLAEANGVTLSFEGSVGGGIPLIAPLRQTLAANRIRSIYGILNGTTNYILSRMCGEGMSFDEALSAAQGLGYAEADPSADVRGADAARKIAILASLAFRSRVTFPQVRYEGITKITPADIRFAERSGFAPKLLAVTREKDEGIEVFVRPALVPKTHPLSAVAGAFNAVYLLGDPVGEVMLYGQGAGADPTASSVVGDIMEAAHRRSGKGENICYDGRPVLDPGESENVYYLSLLVDDRPKVLAGVAGALGDCGISIASLVQEPREDGAAELMLLTHRTLEKNLERAEALLLGCDYVQDLHTMICLEDER